MMRVVSSKLSMKSCTHVFGSGTGIYSSYISCDVGGIGRVHPRARARATATARDGGPGRRGKGQKKRHINTNCKNKKKVYIPVRTARSIFGEGPTRERKATVAFTDHLTVPENDHELHHTINTSTTVSCATSSKAGQPRGHIGLEG